jgi:hypothetical protein
MIAQQRRRRCKLHHVTNGFCQRLITYYQWIIIDSKVFDVSKFADLHPGGANVLYANSVGAWSQNKLIWLNKFRFQLERTLHRYSLAFIATRSSFDHNTSVCKLEQWQAKKNNSSLYFPENLAKFLMLNQHGLAGDITAHTTQITIESSKLLCANFSSLWSSLNHRGVKKMAKGYHKRSWTR